MTPEEREFVKEAVRWAKANRTAFANRFTDPSRFPGEKLPVSVFMAGSPGAGKTETSKALIDELGNFLRIDPDEFRAEIPGYSGANSWLVNDAVVALVERVLDKAFQQSQSFLLDGTLSSYQVAERNVERSLKRDRQVQVVYVYQSPEQAWSFVRAREEAEGRKIPPDRFVAQFFESRKVVDALKVKFGRDIKIDLKNIDGSDRRYLANVAQVEAAVPMRYTLEQVQQIVQST